MINKIINKVSVKVIKIMINNISIKIMTIKIKVHLFLKDYKNFLNGQ